jgi:hypothetical protein
MRSCGFFIFGQIVKKLLKTGYPPPKVVAFTPILWLRHRNF